MSLDHDKAALVRQIEWYRDCYHMWDLGHDQLIEDVNRATSADTLMDIERVLEAWLDKTGREV